MRRLLYLLLAAALFIAGYSLGGRGLRQVYRSAQAAAEPAEEQPTDRFAAGLLELDLAGLQAVNPQVIGWITIPGTSLSYPLLQGENNDYYLDHNWRGEYSPAGSIFLEVGCPADLSGFNTILYGHRMSRDAMFHSLLSYESADYLAAHPRVYLVTGDGVRVYAVFAALAVTVSDPVYWLVDERAAYRQDMIDFCMTRSAVYAGIWPTTESRILTLSTCNGLSASDGRWVVMAMETEVLGRE